MGHLDEDLERLDHLGDALGDGCPALQFDIGRRRDRPDRVLGEDCPDRLPIPARGRVGIELDHLADREAVAYRAVRSHRCLPGPPRRWHGRQKRTSRRAYRWFLRVRLTAYIDLSADSISVSISAPSCGNTAMPIKASSGTGWFSNWKGRRISLDMRWASAAALSRSITSGRMTPN